MGSKRSPVYHALGSSREARHCPDLCARRHRPLIWSCLPDSFPPHDVHGQCPPIRHETAGDRHKRGDTDGRCRTPRSKLREAVGKQAAIALGSKRGLR